MPYLLALPRRWNKAHTTKKLMWAFGICFSVLLGWSGTVRAAVTNPQLWLAPPDNITQPSSLGFDGFLEHPNEWAAAARRTSVFSVPANYFAKSPPAVARKLLERISAAGVKLDVGISAIEVDKRVCGDGIEGMVWPGEVALAAQKLKDLGANVDSFGFDLPLTSGSISQAPRACRFPVAETARRLAHAVAILHQYYPRAGMFDAEVPTGLPIARWSVILSQWLTAYRTAAGANFNGLSMDVWYHGNWQDVVAATAAILDKHGVPAGVTLDASEGPEVTPAHWIGDTKRIYCMLRDTRAHMQFVVVADWLDLSVPSLPDSDRDTLTGLLTWVASADSCKNLGRQ